MIMRLKTMDPAQKAAELDALASRVILPYICIIVVLCILAFLVYKSSLPEIDTDNEDEAVAAANSNKRSIFQFPHLLLGVLHYFFM